ncbi:recombinase family protein [Bradyrhizobium diazoefficiens]|uniref:recombinase family protein n=1 Tax=Bradyrhizobium diazoefficiens TaxID=1355477 RepID=UPI00384FFBC5
MVFAKLDRLTRNVDLLRSLVASDVDLVFCDLPSVPPGPMGKVLLTQMASVAELEAGLIGERTKKALAATKARSEARQPQRCSCSPWEADRQC